MFTPVIMAGGSGSRLWPYSRQQFPKQFLKLFGEYSMLQQTLLRLKGIDTHPPVIVCSEEHRFIVDEQLKDIGIEKAQVILEPEGRNTAPALAVASLILREKDEVLVALAADHYIADEQAFRDQLLQAISVAQKEYLVTFGIHPTNPETGYGYIKMGERLGESEECAHKVIEFVEKPDLDTAISYLSSGNYCWNSGMFAFRPSVFLNELKEFQPSILEACSKAVKEAEHFPDFTRVGKQAFLSCPSDSVDYAIMEHTQKSAVIRFNCGWSDVGSWSSVLSLNNADESEMTLLGDAHAINSSNCYVRSENRFVSLIGVKDLVVIETSDAILIADRNETQAVKQVVQKLAQDNRGEATENRKVYRPWGSYDSVDSGNRYQVKKISVKPGASLSLQKHHHRAEHWIVVKGTAEVTCDDKLTLVSENESTYIPLGCKHRLKNPGKVTLELIEIQSGAYLGEDDIVRYEDTYGRIQ